MTSPTFVPDGKYSVSPQRMSWLLRRVPDGEEFAQAYMSMTLKELREFFGEDDKILQIDDVYILMNHYRIPYKYPGYTSGRKSGSRAKSANRSIRAFDALEEVESRAPRTDVEIDYDLLSDLIVTKLARYILKGYTSK